jgi:hypothetical protein
LYGVLAKRALARDPAVTVTTYAMLFGALLLTPAALVEGLLPALGRLDGGLLALVVFLGVPGGALAFLLWTWALSRLTPTQVAVYVNFNPVSPPCLGFGCWVSGAAWPLRSASRLSWPASAWSTGPGRPLRILVDRRDRSGQPVDEHPCPSADRLESTALNPAICHFAAIRCA